MNYNIVRKFILRSDYIIDEQTVPLYDLQAVAGISSLYVGNETPTEQIQIQGVPPCNGAIPVIGDSMEPLFTAGDIALYRIVPNRRGGLYFGNIYLIAFDLDGEECITIKYVHESETPGYYRLESENPRHKPREIPASSVRLMGIVQAIVRPI